MSLIELKGYIQQAVEDFFETRSDDQKKKLEDLNNMQYTQNEMIKFLPEVFRKSSFKEEVMNSLKDSDLKQSSATCDDFEKKTKEDIVMNRIKLIENTREIHRVKQEL